MEGRSAYSETKSIDELKSNLIDRFLLFGTILGFIVLLISIFPLSTLEFNFDFYGDLFSLVALLSLYFTRHKIDVSLKAIIIIAFIFFMFINDLLENGSGSTDQVLMVLIPFLTVLVFNVRAAVILIIGILISYTIIAYAMINGIITSDAILPEENTTSAWINSISTITLVAFILSIFVHSFNNSMTLSFLQLKKSNDSIQKRDKELEQNIKEKDVLLQEIHHRVKNNLAVVSGLLNLQSTAVDDQYVQNILSKSMHRIMSIAKVHELLYQSDDFSKIDFNIYIQELVNIHLNSLSNQKKEVTFKNDVNLDFIDLNYGVPIGIILNELITNSLKHAFDESISDPTILISATKMGNKVIITYRDNGKGITEDSYDPKESLGTTLIDSLLQQIDATYEANFNDGYEFEFSFDMSSIN